MKKVLSIILAILMFVSAVPFGVFANEADALNEGEYSGRCGEKLNWSLDVDSGVLTIDGKGEMFDYECLCDYKDGIRYYSTAPWSDYYKELTSVIISDGVRSIGENAFLGCSSLEEISIGDDVESIGYEAFYSCGKLSSVSIPKSIKTIGEYAFLDCSSLCRVDITDIDKWAEIDFDNNLSNPLYYAHNLYLNGEAPSDFQLSEGISKIGKYAFYDCDNITSVGIPNSVGEIGYRAFYNCDQLQTVVIPDSVNTMGDEAFDNCNSLNYTKYDNGKYLGNSDNRYLLLESAVSTVITSCEIKDNTKFISDKAFYDCKQLTSITIPDSVISIGSSAFCYCSLLTDVVIGKNVVKIGDYAFEYCNSIKNLDIPDSVVSIGDFAFCCGFALENLSFGSGLKSIGNGAFTYCQVLSEVNLPELLDYLGVCAFSGCSSLTSVKIPENIKDLYEGVFSECIKLADVSLPYGMKSIGDSAFNYCTSLKEITIPDSTEIIGSRAFAYSALEKISMPENLIYIGAYAFDHCSSLTSLNIPNGVTTVGDGVVNYCSSLSYNNYDNACYLGNQINPYLYLAKATDTGISSCVINPDTVFIGSRAFCDCASLTKLSIPDSVKQIATSAFSYCVLLAELSLGNSIENIAESAFSACSSLQSVAIPGNVKKIGFYAFQNCSMLSDVTIEYGVTKIAYSAFSCCSSLQNISIPESVTDLGADVFSSCISLKSITLPSNISSLGVSLFYGCSSLESISIPYNVKSIGNSAFENCSSLKSITLYDSLCEIGNYVFEGCDALSSIVYYGEQSDFEKIDIGVANQCFNNASKIYYTQVVSAVDTTVTVANLIGVSAIMFSSGHCTSYREVKNERVFGITSAKFTNLNRYSYKMPIDGEVTVYITYTEPLKPAKFCYINISSPNPTITQDGLNITVDGLTNIKCIKRAFGRYSTLAQVKTASGVITYGSDVAKGTDSAVLHIPHEGELTVAIQYNSGYTVIKNITIEQKCPSFVQDGNKVIIGNLDDLYVVRYAKGTFAKPNAIKAAKGSKYLRADAIADGYITVDNLERGTYTFLVQYYDESQNIYTITVE